MVLRARRERLILVRSLKCTPRLISAINLSLFCRLTVTFILFFFSVLHTVQGGRRPVKVQTPMFLYGEESYSRNAVVSMLVKDFLGCEMLANIVNFMLTLRFLASITGERFF